MSDIDYDLLRSGTGGDPSDGMHAAALVRAALVETSRGSMLVTEWQTTTGTPYYWTAWHGFDGQRLGFTQDYLDGLGIDRGAVTDDDAFEEALDGVRGQVFEVRTETNGRFVNTFVEGPAGTVQEQLDVPIERSDLPPAGVATTAAPDARDPSDDDIPF